MNKSNKNYFVFNFDELKEHKIMMNKNFENFNKNENQDYVIKMMFPVNFIAIRFGWF